MRRAALLVLVVGLLAAAVAWWFLDDRPDSPVDMRGVEPEKGPVPPAFLRGSEAAHPSQRPEAHPSTSPDPPRTRQIRGIVYDDRGVPVAGARLHSLGEGWIGSGEDGRFEITVADGAAIVSCLGAPGFRRRIWRSRVVRVAPNQDFVEIVLTRGPSLAVRVVDPDGRPVAGAWVHTMDERMIEGRTDAKGRAVLELDDTDTEHRVWVSARELDPPHPDAVFGPFRAGPGEHVLRLSEAHWIEGLVCWAGGQPAVLEGGGATVEVADVFWPLRAAADGRTGRFRIGPIARGEHEVRAWWGKESFAPAHYEKVSVPCDSVRLAIPDVVTFECTVALAEGATIAQATWVVEGAACEIVRFSRAPDRLRELLPDVVGTFYVRDSEGRYAYFPDVRLRDVPGTILLSEGGEISGVLVYDDLASVVLETRGVPIRGEVDLVADIDEPPFRIRGLFPGAEGVLRVLAGKHDPKVVHEQRAASGNRDLRLEIPLSED